MRMLLPRCCTERGLLPPTGWSAPGRPSRPGIRAALVTLGLLLALATGASGQTITTNQPWSADQTHSLGRNPTWTGDLPAPPAPFSTTLSSYQSQRSVCAGNAHCEVQLVRNPILFNSAYGWWCGGGRPVDANEARTLGPLDPVDMCCKLHDKGVWAAGQEAACGIASSEKEILDACGIVMCLSSRTPVDWSAFPDVEEARQFWLKAALSLCLGGCGTATSSDQDCDGVPDDADICLVEPDPAQTDTDHDLVGNRCDCDFNNDGSCNIQDFNVFLPDFVSSTDGGSGTDMDGDGSVGIADFNRFLPGFASGKPGPGLQTTCESFCGNGFCDAPAENCGDSLLGCSADCGLCANGSFCLSDADCSSGVCNNLFQCASCKVNGQACLTDGVCCSGICNNLFQCASCKSNGQACLSDGVCCSGICNNLFQCASCRNFGQLCSSDGECCSGNCSVLGTCGL